MEESSFTDVVLYLAVAALVFALSWQFLRESAVSMFSSRTNAEFFAFGMSVLAAGAAASLIGEAVRPVFAMLAVSIASIGTSFSRVELVFQRTVEKKDDVLGKTTRRELLVALIQIVASFIVWDTLLTILAALPLSESLRWLAVLLSAGLTAYGLTRDLGPLGEVFQEFESPEAPLSANYRTGKSRISWSVAVILGSIILIAIAFPGADMLLTLGAIAGYIGGIGLIVLLFRPAGRRR
jgi:hypothetical protein